MVNAIWEVVDYQNLFSCASSNVRNRDGVVDRIPWTYFKRSAFLANENRLCTEQCAECNRCCLHAEACADIAFSFTLQPNSGWDCLAFADAAECPCDQSAVNFCFRLASQVSYTFRQCCGNDNFAHIAACRNLNVQRVLIAQHAHLWIHCTDCYAIAAAFA